MRVAILVFNPRVSFACGESGNRQMPAGTPALQKKPATRIALRAF
jgi:hypothetical protein